MRLGFGSGALVAILVSLIFPILGLVSLLQGVSILLLFVGIWSLAFGAILSKSGRIYYPGWGIVLVALSSFSVLPLQYTAVFVIVALIVLVVLSVKMRK